MARDGIKPSTRGFSVPGRWMKHQLHQQVSRGARCLICPTMQRRAGLIPAKLPHGIRDRAALFDAVVRKWITGATTTKVTDQLRSYGVARRELMLETIHSNDRYANSRARLSHQPTRARQRGMAPLQLAGAGAAFLEHPRCRLQPVQPAAPPGVGGVLSTSSGARFPTLARSRCGVRSGGKLRFARCR